MAISFAPAAAAAKDEVHRALADLRADTSATNDLGGADQRNLSAPIPVYRLLSNQFTNQDVLERAERVGWRYLVEGYDDGGGGADVGSMPDGVPRFTSYSRGPSFERLAAAASFAEKAFDSESASYELRLLDMPSMHISAIWMAGPQDFFIVYRDVGTVNQLKIEDKAEFLGRMRSIAGESQRKRHLSTAG